MVKLIAAALPQEWMECVASTVEPSIALAVSVPFSKPTSNDAKPRGASATGLAPPPTALPLSSRETLAALE